MTQQDDGPTIDGLLHHTGLSSLELNAQVSLTELVDLHSIGRPKLLQRLKELGVDSLSARQTLANAIGRFRRDGTFSQAHAEARREASAAAAAPAETQPVPPGHSSVNVRCAGNLGGDCCPGKGHLRNTAVHTATKTLQAFYEELKRTRGYTLNFSQLRVSVDGTMTDLSEAAKTPVRDGMNCFFIGPNNGG